MAIKVLMIVIFLAISAGGGTLLVLNRRSKNTKQMLIYQGILVAGLLLFAFIPWNIRAVQAGEVAVVKVWGEAKYTRGPGTYWDDFFTKKYVIYDAKIQQIDIQTECYSSDGQTMSIDLTVQYQIQPNHSIEIANNYGDLDTLTNRIKAVATEKTKSVLSKKSAMLIIETRSEVSPTVETAIRNAITDEYYADITTAVLTDISFTDEFEKTVENKMIAEQEKIKAEYEKEKAIIQAEQALAVAKLDAQSKLAAAEGNAKAQIEIAKAEAETIKLKSIEIARMMGFDITETPLVDGSKCYDIDFGDATPAERMLISSYIQYIEYLKVWNGELPTTLVTDDAASIILQPQT